MTETIPLLALADLFPRGILPYALGGLLVGLGASIIYLSTGVIAGASTFLESTLSYVSDIDRFNRFTYLQSRGWRFAFTAGIVSGAAIWGLVLDPGIWTTEVQWWRLLGGGFLVGIGTRVGKGCTSGHGICGVGSLSRTSLIGVTTFLFVAIVTAAFVAALGVVP